MNILLIEDNPDHVVLTKRIIDRMGQDCRFDTVPSVCDAVNTIAQTDYDVILCDYRLGDCNAFDFLREIKTGGKDVAVVVVTSTGNEKIAVDLMKEGAYDYICKDVSYEETLPFVIRRAWEQCRMLREKKRIESELFKSEKRYRMLVENIPAITYLVRLNESSAMVYVSIQVETILGYKPEEVIADREFWIKHVHPHDIDRITQELRRCQKDLQPFSAEYRMFSRSGAEVWMRDSAYVMHDRESGEILFQGVMLDITKEKNAHRELEEAYRELKGTQEQLIQSGKMAAMGQLATGISHELNQPLTGIKGFAQALLMDLDPASPLRKDVARIIEQTDRMDRIVKNVRFFTRKSEFTLKAINVNKSIEDSLALLEEQLKVHNIRLEKRLDPALPNIMGDANQLQQAFINLITNARDAVDSLRSPSGGTLTVRSSAASEGKRVEVILEDTGCGISQENIRNIFNPFFTTKSPSGGMGLGLSIVYRIIENHKGTITAQSEEGKGSAFIITLPVAMPEDAAKASVISHAG